MSWEALVWQPLFCFEISLILVSVNGVHKDQVLMGFAAFQVHGSSSSRRFTGCPSFIFCSTSRM